MAFEVTPLPSLNITRVSPLHFFNRRQNDCNFYELRLILFLRLKFILEIRQECRASLCLQILAVKHTCIWGVRGITPIGEQA